ncbi:MAG: hypothetical protein Q9M20_03730 [Mariprofundaceae bacterium]|nr:hypothetical protein [Mariprofundaceae bacterium]
MYKSTLTFTAKAECKEAKMLGRHQKTTGEETTLIKVQWRKLRTWHLNEKKRLKRAMNKRFRQEGKREILFNQVSA